MAMLMSMVALTIDSMLPALAQIAQDLNADHANDAQFIIGAVFLGMALGQMIYGPISDSFGRKPAIYLGVSIFIVGDIISLMASDFHTMLIGRVLQGMGASACRVVSLAMIRDCFSGRHMARVMSLIMLVFIMVPAIAPSIGQLILIFAEWHGIFWVLLGFSLTAVVWLALRQPETLDIEKRVPFSLANIWIGIKETINHNSSRNYTIAGGIMFGALVGYLTSSQQLLQIRYGLGDLFSVYFGLLALTIGLASFANSRLVMKINMEKLCIYALCLISVASLAFFLMSLLFKGLPPFPILFAYLMIAFSGFGILFGNFNALAVHALGHIAGVANSVISTIQTLISVLVGSIIGQLFDDTVFPLVIGFFFCSTLALVIVLRVRHKYGYSDMN
ncbi:bicyclomycin resistance protein [Oceanobacter sp. RED65]|uniref:Bcr/CflA family efflux transporter n=2 Tax=Bermanella marisrubri TaxID=207949 RepID=Q1MYK8_9GAMM|nr:bicyclomycin resistance protein [Oceanobacter sp. RED65] [Bermanella marisrubri]